MANKPTRTSYSALTTFEACPRSYKLYYLDEIKVESDKAAANRGTRLHLACERYLKGDIPYEKLPIDFRLIKLLLEDFKRKGAVPEQEWLIRDDTWEIQAEETPETSFKAILDIHYVEGDTLYIYDLKTGRKYPEHEDQLQAYALVGLCRYPEVQQAVVAALYLEGLGNPTPYHRAMLPHLQDRWKERWDKLFTTHEYPPTPSLDACRWCDYKATKGGQCEYF